MRSSFCAFPVSADAPDDFNLIYQYSVITLHHLIFRQFLCFNTAYRRQKPRISLSFLRSPSLTEIFSKIEGTSSQELQDTRPCGIINQRNSHREGVDRHGTNHRTGYRAALAGQ